MGLTPRGKSPSQNNAAAIVGLRVRFELGARHGLRRVVFAMERNKQTSTTVEWVIEFQLFERRSRAAAFEQMASLRVELDAAQHQQAEAVAARGLSDEQTARAIGPAADDAQAYGLGKLEPNEARDSVRDIVR